MRNLHKNHKIFYSFFGKSVETIYFNHTDFLFYNTNVIPPHCRHPSITKESDKRRNRVSFQVSSKVRYR